MSSTSAFRAWIARRSCLALRSEIAISNGAACTSSGHSPSHVLRSMGLTDDLTCYGSTLLVGTRRQQRSHTKRCWRRSRGSDARLAAVVGQDRDARRVGVAPLSESSKSVSMAGFELQLPGIRGKQAGQDYYLVMCPLRHIPRLFQFADEGFRPNFRPRGSSIRDAFPKSPATSPRTRTLMSCPRSLARSTRTFCSKPAPGKVGSAGLGMLKLPISTRLLIHDGLHRRAAIEIGFASQARARRRDDITRLVRRSRVSEIGADLLGFETPRVSFLSLAGNYL